MPRSCSGCSLFLVLSASGADDGSRPNALSRRTRKHKVTTNSNHSLGTAPNLLDGDFVADMPNRKWAGDISYVWTSEGWLYLAVILDLHSRRVVGQFGGVGQSASG